MEKRRNTASLIYLLFFFVSLGGHVKFLAASVEGRWYTFSLGYIGPGENRVVSK